MAKRSFVRDSIGRFAKSAGQAIGREAKQFAKEAAEDAKRVAKAKAAEALSAAKAEVQEAKREADRVEASKADQNTDSEFLDWEIERKKARDALRKARLKQTAAKAAEIATRKF